MYPVVTTYLCLRNRPGGEESLQMKTKHSVPTYVIEIQDPIGNNSTPVQLNTEEGDPQKSGLPKDGHGLPPYVESCAATLTSSGGQICCSNKCNSLCMQNICLCPCGSRSR